MKADTVLIDLNEVKVGFWNRLRDIATDDEVSVKDFLVEMRSQILIIESLESGENDGREADVH